MIAVVMIPSLLQLLYDGPVKVFKLIFGLLWVNDGSTINSFILEIGVCVGEEEECLLLFLILVLLLHKCGCKEAFCCGGLGLIQAILFFIVVV